MRRSIVAVFLLLLAGQLVQLEGQAGRPAAVPGRSLAPGAADRQPEPVAVTFRVLDEQTGAPVARAMVARAMVAPMETGGGGMTGETGEVVLMLPARDGPGVRVSRPGYEDQTANIETSPVVVKLRRMALVRGTVLDRHQEPVVGLKVEAVTKSVQDGWRESRVYTWCETNDLGEYRLGELRAGTYEIRVAGKSSGIMFLGPRPTESGVRERYRSVSETVELRAGEVREQPFQVEAERAFLVSGQLVNYSKRAIPQVTLRGTDGTPIAARFAMNYETGAFEFRDVAPGEYRLAAKAGSPNEGVHDVSEIAVTVAKEDVTNVAVELTEPVPVEVVSRGCEQAKRLWLSLLRVSPAGEGRQFPIGGQVVDQKMIGRGLSAGRYKLRLEGDDCVPYAMRVGDQDVMANGLVVGTGMDRVRLDVEFGKSGGVKVKLPERKDSAPLRVLAMPARAKGLHFAAEPALGEQWMARRLSPGEYIVAAWLADRELAYHEDDVQDLIRRHGVRVAVAAGATAEVELRELIP